MREITETKGGVEVQCQGRVLVEAVELAGTDRKNERVVGNMNGCWSMRVGLPI